MARSIPKVREGSLQQQSKQGTSTDTISIGTAEWYTWLEEHHSFAFETPRMTFTARKEQRPGGWYWYAYRRRQGKLYSAYLGKSTELTLQRLNATAEALEGTGEDLAGGTDRPRWVSGDTALQGHQASFIAFPTTRTGAERLKEPEPEPKHTLPVQLTPLIGREQEVTMACNLLRHSEVRLLTLTGTPGVGKTHLALQVARELIDDFADGIWFVPLAPIRDPDLLISSIAKTFDIGASGRLPILDFLQVYLQHKHLLLVLDNFEQLVIAAPLLTTLLEACPQVKMLVTSREVLHLRAEQQFLVLPLSLPDLKHLPDMETLSQYPAVALFLQRGQAVKPHFQLTLANATTMAEICIRLDGLPLAIELAAAHIKFLSPQALLARLDRRLQVLISGARDLPERQQTLLNTIKWSYELLNDEEQRLFQRLSVFVGGCTLEAAERVAPADEAGSVMDGMTSLIDKSLLQQIEQEGEEPRFMMLETIREYALEGLESSDEKEAIQRAHALYYLQLAEEAEPRLLSAEQMRWIQRLDQEQHNLRAALLWLLATQKREQALRLSSALWAYWSRSHVEEGVRCYEQVLAASTQDITKERVDTLNMAASLVHFQRDYPLATEMLETSLRLARALSYQRGIALALCFKGQIALDTGDYAALHASMAASLPLLRELGEAYWLALGLYAQAHDFHFRGDWAQARAVGEEALAIIRELGEPHGPVWILNALGYFAYTQGDLVTAYQRYEETLQAAKATQYKPLIAPCLIALGAIAARREQAMQAARFWGANEGTRITPDLAFYSWFANIVRTQLGYEQLLMRVRAQLGEEAFITAWNEGQTMTVEQLLGMQGLEAEVQQNTRVVSSSPSLIGLTAREVEVLRLLAQGMTSHQIAERLILSLHTVNAHVRSIYTKLELNSRSALTRYAIEQHLL